MSGTRPDTWLERVFNAPGRDAQLQNYAGWAESYDADMMAVGYATPVVVLSLLSRFLRPGDGPVLDAGCGTGLVGELAAVLGLGPLTGIDMSQAMLARAARRGAYAELHVAVLGERLPFADGAFAAGYATGVFTAGHAPPESLDELVRVTRPGGHIAFNVGEQAQAAFASRLAALEAAGRWRRVAESRPFRPLPLSAVDGQLTARAFAFEVMPAQ